MCIRDSHHRVPDRFAGGPFGLDLVDQDHRVLRNHTDQRQNAEDGNKAERFAGCQQGGHHADQAQRHQAQNLSLIHI